MCGNDEINSVKVRSQQKPVIVFCIDSHLGSVVVAADVTHEFAICPDCNHVNIAPGKLDNSKSNFKWEEKPVLVVAAEIPKPPFFLKSRHCE